MMKRIILLFLMSGLVWNVFAQQDEYAKKILDAMSQKYKSIPSYKANFVYKLENKVENINEMFKGEIIVKGDKYHLLLSDQEIYNNGKTIWTYLKDANEVNIDNYVPESGDMSPSNIYNAYKNGYKYQFVEEKKEGSKGFNVIELQPEDPEDRNKMFFKVILNIDKSTNLIDNWKMYDRTGNVYTYTISGFNPDYKVTEENFEFDQSKYPGVEVVDLR